MFRLEEMHTHVQYMHYFDRAEDERSVQLFFI